jgi:hypothetical protein
MSRVADALKRANTMNGELARTGDAGSGRPSDFNEHNVQGKMAQEEIAPGEHLSEEPTADPLQPGNSRGLAARVLRSRWMRRILRLLRIRTGGPVPTCTGMTKLGQPCRAPAMANGLCHQHGGSRSIIMSETVRDVMERISPAR